MTRIKRTQRKYVQETYRVRNWQEYETGLRATPVHLLIDSSGLSVHVGQLRTPRFPRLSHPGLAHATPSTGFMAEVYRAAGKLTDQQRAEQAPAAARSASPQTSITAWRPAGPRRQIGAY